MISIKSLLTESKTINTSKELRYHIENAIPVSKNIFRHGSKKFFEVINEAKSLYRDGKYYNEMDLQIFETDLGEWAVYEGENVPLDLPFVEINEAEYQGRDVELGKPKRGGSKKFYVYVKDPQSDNVRKIAFGAKDGGGSLSVKIKDPERRRAFADRHNCKDKKDRTSPGYWSCRLPYYAKTLGLGDNMSTYW